MFKRRWLCFGRIRSDEGFSVYYGHRTVYYSDERGEFQIGYEDGLLFPDLLPESHKALILNRVLQALEWDGHNPRVWTAPVRE
jgi:hypothetical protein